MHFQLVITIRAFCYYGFGFVCDGVYSWHKSHLCASFKPKDILASFHYLKSTTVYRLLSTQCYLCFATWYYFVLTKSYQLGFRFGQRLAAYLVMGHKMALCTSINCFGPRVSIDRVDCFLDCWLIFFVVGLPCGATLLTWQCHLSTGFQVQFEALFPHPQALKFFICQEGLIVFDWMLKLVHFVLCWFHPAFFIAHNYWVLINVNLWTGY